MSASLIRLVGRRGGFEVDVEVAWDAPVLALLGASGAGKSTVVEAMLGLWRGARGRVVLGGEVLQDTGTGTWLPPDARGLGWVPQDLGLFPHLTVDAQLAYGAGGAGGAGGADVDVSDVASRLGLGALGGRRIDALSGGERQRVALGRALASKPRALLLDEPLASLDRPLRARILADLLALKSTGMPMVYVSHDLHEVWALADEVAVIDSGRVVAHGPVREVLASPTVADTLAHEGIENVFEGTLEAEDSPGLHRCLTTGEVALFLPAFPGEGAPGDRVRIAVRAEDVVLATEDPGLTSAQNVLEGTIEACDDVAGQPLVAVRVGGDLWQVQVTHRAVDRLALEPGRPVRLLVKAHAVHLVGVRSATD